MEETELTNDGYGDLDPNFRTPCIYLYYCTNDPRPEWSVRAFFVQRAYNIDDIEAEIPKLVNEVKSGHLEPSGWALGDLRWRRLSYIVVILEDSHHTLAEKNAVEFSYYHSFRGGHDYTRMAADGITAYYCENRLVDNRGNILTAQSRPETFRVVVNHDGHAHGKLKIFSHEDTGTNMGPPVPPP